MLLELGVLIGAGVLAGYVNAVAGAGSLLTLPALIFTGLDAGAANATNRIAVLFQNAAAIVAFRRGGVRFGTGPWILCIPAGAGAVGGAWVATLLSDSELRLAIAVAMVVFLGLTFASRKKDAEQKAAADGPPTPPALRWTMFPGFLAIGFYAGFLQAGVGVVILLYLSLAYGADLVGSNALKVTVILVLAAVALGVFALAGETIDAVRGLSLAAATTVGGYLGARDSLVRGERFVRVILVLAVLLSAAKLTWDALGGAD